MQVVSGSGTRCHFLPAIEGSRGDGVLDNPLNPCRNNALRVDRIHCDERLAGVIQRRVSIECEAGVAGAHSIGA